ncbi:MAG: hypothetical protein Q4E03_03830 [Trueperella sp.]|nr:hypothetical protein [Trueperella sp.]
MTQIADKQLADTRPRTFGWPAVFIGVLCVAAVFFALRGIISAAIDFTAGEPLAATGTILSALAWVCGGVGLAHNGRRMRRVAWSAWALNTVVPILTLAFQSDWLNSASPWFSGGSTYFYLPTVGAALALGWLFWSQPARVAARNAKPASENTTANN